MSSMKTDDIKVLKQNCRHTRSKESNFHSKKESLGKIYNSEVIKAKVRRYNL